MSPTKVGSLESVEKKLDRLMAQIEMKQATIQQLRTEINRMKSRQNPIFAEEISMN
jgi:chaperonin cofactor prefoldin